MDTASALYLAPLSQSLSYRFYYEIVHGVPILEWWVDQVTRQLGLSALSIICHSNQERDTIARVAKSAHVHLAGQSGIFRSLKELAEQKGCRRIALIPFGFCLAPD